MAAEYREELICKFEVPRSIVEKRVFSKIVDPLLASEEVLFDGTFYRTARGDFSRYVATGDAIETMRSLLASLGCTRKP